MVSIALHFLAARVAAAAIIGLAVGASIRSAERFRIEEMVTDLFSFLARRQPDRF